MRARRLSPATKGHLCLWLALAVHISAAAGLSGADHVDLALTASPGGKAPSQTVEWYRRGPFPPVSPSNPPTFIRGVAVKADGRGGAVLARWESTRTTIVAFYPKLNGLWSLPGGAGTLISVAVQYGGRVVDLYMLRFEGNALRVVGLMTGENESVMTIEGQLVVEVVPDDYYRVPTLFAWNGTQFSEASPEFPAFYIRLAKAYLEGIHNSQQLPPEALVQDCQLAFQAYDLAKQPVLGHKACIDAKQRISTGWRLVPGLAAYSAKDFEREREAALKRIDHFVEPKSEAANK